MRFLAFLAAIAIGLPALAQSFGYPRPGDTVWTSDGYTATVQGVFPNGNVSVRIGASNYNYRLDQLATRGCHLNGPCSGQAVYTSDGYTATMNGVFPTREYSVRIGASNYRYGETQIAGQGCRFNLCSGQQVVTNDGYNATVNGIFPDGSVSVRIGSSNYKYNYSQLAGRDPSHPPYPGPGGGVRVGDAVWTSDGYSATVNGVFPDGMISVRIGANNYRYQRQQIAARGCIGMVCSGRSVVTSDGYNATVNGVFPDGMVSVRIGASNYRYRYDQLAVR